ncbi:MAG: hypothetical protein MPI95_01065 [Nitrosopumilus sp.]|nr:hypothetical protein [Nitrosopumilus sp.]MDA7942785.1 hypothetical protein [Nitrosopumilus sp.]MDA7952699.1 hypothetical protein [Nitrosopumilus sp.]MDA7957670.1 hypothetical protein [Nitrosopumilus sp.]MDA7960294.1 hypothetical protein [Nitrosopumilus sp.]
MSDLGGLEASLVAEAGLDPLQARAFVSVCTGGMADAAELARRLGVPESDAGAAASELVRLGAFISMPDGYESTHPRFAAVRMYRAHCEGRGERAGRNDAIDAVGAALEGPYDAARTG